MTSPLLKLLPVLVAASLLASTSPLRRPQYPPPPAPDPVLLQASQCLVAKKFLVPPPHTESLSLGSVLDEYSFPGKKVIYVVNFASTSNANGAAFEIFIEEEDNGLGFNIQNNARYELSKKEMSGVTFIDPPQGDASEEHPFASAIKKIAAAPRTTIPVKDLSPLDPSATCEAYTDKN